MFRCLKRGPGFYGYLWRLTGPIALQNLITFSLGLIDTLMVSWLGNTQMAAVTTANVPVFLLISIVFGVQSGLGILVSQYWGKKDMESISRAIGVAAMLGTGITLVLALVLFLWPVQIMDLLSNKHELSVLGAPYLKLIGFSYVFNMLSSIYVSAMRSAENSGFGMKLFGVSTLLNTGMNYLLIFGKCGLPALGIQGAAIATLLSRVAEFLICLVCALRSRILPLDLGAFLRPGWEMLRRFVKYSTPVILNELTGEVTFKKNEKDLLEADAVIVDEMSMVDLPLMDALLAALKPGCRLVMVGDPDQLPSVGPGNVLGDILRSGAVDSVTLTEVFRQAEQSAIIRSAHAVNRGQAPDLSNKQSDFFFLCRRSPDRLVQTVVDLCRTRLPDKMGIPAGQIQVLTPTRKGETGTVSLNRALQAALNPPAPGKRQKAWGDMIFRVGDRVMQTRNNYDVLWEKDDGEAGSGIFNGDVGTVEDIDPSGELVTIRFDDRTSVYTADLLSQLDMAYAMTVHKAQGSEYRAVVLVSAPAAPNLLVRGVLYTAITRARELLVMVGDDAIPGRMAENDRRTRRYSGLRRRLKQGGPSHGHE